MGPHPFRGGGRDSRRPCSHERNAVVATPPRLIVATRRQPSSVADLGAARSGSPRGSVFGAPLSMAYLSCRVARGGGRRGVILKPRHEPTSLYARATARRASPHPPACPNVGWRALLASRANGHRTPTMADAFRPKEFMLNPVTPSPDTAARGVKTLRCGRCSLIAMATGSCQTLVGRCRGLGQSRRARRTLRRQAR